MEVQDLQGVSGGLYKCWLKSKGERDWDPREGPDPTGRVRHYGGGLWVYGPTGDPRDEDGLVGGWGR